MTRFTIMLLLCFFSLAMHSCYKDETVYESESNNRFELPAILIINGKQCAFDYATSSLRFPIAEDSITNFAPFVEFQDYSTVKFDTLQLTNHSINQLGKVQLNKQYTISVTTGHSTQYFTLEFTNLAIVQIITNYPIINEPKSLARILINYPETSKPSFNSFIGIEHRGATSLIYPKKSYGITLLGSMDIKNSVSIPLIGTRANSDWILDAMYIDNARLRNKVSFQIWNSIPNNNSHHEGIVSQYVELYHNNQCLGIFCFNENLNAELIGLTDEGAVLYKSVDWANGSTLFETLTTEPPATDYWDGWEYKYPDPKMLINWQPLYNLRNLIVNSSNQEFFENIANYIDIQSFIDYYLFLNLSSAFDNTGKNIFLFKRAENSLIECAPWDVDASWGIMWDGNRVASNGILSNRLYQRLFETNPDGFKTKLKLRWFELRNDSFSENNIQLKFNQSFDTLQKSDIIQIENSIWYFTISLNEEQTYLNKWIAERLVFLDNYFSQF